jgi:single-stranded DNA-binding protein
LDFQPENEPANRPKENLAPEFAKNGGLSMQALITGILHKAPETRTSVNGNAFTLATLKTQQQSRDGATETLFVSLVAFNDQARETIARLKTGDALSVGGKLTVGIWEREGIAHPSLNLVADTAATARPKPKPQKLKGNAEGLGAAHGYDDDFNDPLTF